MLVVEEVHHAGRPVAHGDKVRGRPVQAQQAEGGALLHAVHGVSERQAGVRPAWPRAQGQHPQPQGTEPTDTTPRPQGTEPTDTTPRPQGTEPTDNTRGPRGQRCTSDGAGGTRGKREKGFFGRSTPSSSGCHSPQRPRGGGVRLWPRTEAHMDLLTTKLAIPTRLLPMAVTKTGG